MDSLYSLLLITLQTYVIYVIYVNYVVYVISGLIFYFCSMSIPRVRSQSIIYKINISQVSMIDCSLGVDSSLSLTVHNQLC